MKMKLGELSVTCKMIGPDMQPWGRGDYAYKYRVTVSHGRARYTSPAWGSIYDYSNRRQNCEGIAAMVVDELCSAAADPDEYLEMVVGDGGEGIVKRVKSAEKTIAAAKKFGYDTLSRAQDEAREKGLL